MQVQQDKSKGKALYYLWRRTQDLYLSVIILGLLFVPILAVAALIVLDSPGASPIFKQLRVGKDGKTFEMLKFRSMYPDAEARLEALQQKNEMDGPVFKIKNDPRITRVGRVIRKTGFDEILQLVNVIRGEMSIIGPRPALPNEVEQYTDEQRLRLKTKPGITCLWQIQPKRNSLSFDEWLRLDLLYMKTRSWKNDWRILFGTVAAVFRADGE